MSASKENTNSITNIHITNSIDEVTKNIILFEEWNKVIGIENHNTLSIENLENLFTNIEIKQTHQNDIRAEIKDEGGSVCVVTTSFTTLSEKKWRNFFEEICKSESLYQFSNDDTLNEILENVVKSNYLFPSYPEELQYSGSCNIGIPICSHVKLLHQYFGFQMINDPFYLLSLRGLTRMRFLTILKQLIIELFANKSSSQLDNSPITSYVSISQDVNTYSQSINDEEKHPSNSFSKDGLTKSRFENFYHIPANHQPLNITDDNSTHSENFKYIVSGWNPLSKKIMDREENPSPNKTKFGSSIEQLVEHPTQEPTYYYHNQMLKSILYNTGPIPKKNQFKVISNLQKIKGIGPKYAHALLQSGISDSETLAKLDGNQYLDRILKIPQKHLKKIIDNAKYLHTKKKISHFYRGSSLPVQKENMSILKSILNKINFSNINKNGLLQRDYVWNSNMFMWNFEANNPKNSHPHLQYYFYSNCIYVTNQGVIEKKFLYLLSNGKPRFQNFKPISIDERIPKFLHDIKKKKIYELIRSPRQLHELQSFSPNNPLFVQSKLNTIKSTNKVKAFQSSPFNHTFDNNKNNKYQIISIPTTKIHRMGGIKI